MFWEMGKGVPSTIIFQFPKIEMPNEIIIPLFLRP